MTVRCTGHHSNVLTWTEHGHLDHLRPVTLNAVLQHPESTATRCIFKGQKLNRIDRQTALDVPPIGLLCHGHVGEGLGGSVVHLIRVTVSPVQHQTLAHRQETGVVEIYELLSCQELCHLADLTSDWLFTLVQPIRSQLVC